MVFISIVFLLFCCLVVPAHQTNPPSYYSQDVMYPNVVEEFFFQHDDARLLQSLFHSSIFFLFELSSFVEYNGGVVDWPFAVLPPQFLDVYNVYLYTYVQVYVYKYICWSLFFVARDPHDASCSIVNSLSFSLTRSSHVGVIFSSGILTMC